MQSRKRQTGMSIPSILVIMMMIGFFVMCGIRMAPPYFEYLSVREIISNIASEPEAENLSVSVLRRRISDLFNTNQIVHLKPKEVEVYRKKGQTFIDANYEVRVPIMGRIDAVMGFDDLLYITGSDSPVLKSTP